MTDTIASAHLKTIEQRLLWLSHWMIHNANHLRPKSEGIKIGGHQASSASMVSIMTALYFSALRPEDRVAVKPHAGPVFHAMQYMMGNLDRAKMENFRGYGGVQSYPSRTKDADDVDFSTGSVGLGVAITSFASMVQDYIAGKAWGGDLRAGRMIALMGDAEMDEGNILECLQEGWKHDLRNVWWIIDYNRQSLDGVVREGLWTRIEKLFQAFGWDVVRVKYGVLQQAAFAEPGGERLREWIDACPNQLYSALTFSGGAEWRKRLMDDLGDQGDVTALIEARSDAELAALMENLGGNCVETMAQQFAAIKAALDGKLPVMANADKDAGADHLIPVIAHGPILEGIQRLFDLAQTRIHIVGEFLGMGIFRLKRVEFVAQLFPFGTLRIAQVNGDAGQTAQTIAVAIGKIRRDLDPFPTLGGDSLALGLQLLAHQPVEQHRVLQPAAIVLLEEIAQDSATRRLIGLDADKQHPLIGGAHRGFGQQAPDVIRLLLPTVPDRIPDLFLPHLILGDSEGHQLFQRHAILGIDLQQCGRDRRQAQALLHHLGIDEEGGGDLLLAHALVAQGLEGAELIERMQWCPFDILGERYFVDQHVTGLRDHAGHRRGLVQALLLHQ